MRRAQKIRMHSIENQTDIEMLLNLKSIAFNERYKLILPIQEF
jgi:hypothetical protein